MKYCLLLISAILFFASCKKNNTDGKQVEVYLLKMHQPIAGKCQVDAATAILQDTAVVRNDEIVAYSKKEYTFELTTSAIAKIQGLKDRDAFVVTVDKQVIYYGYYKPFISSSSCPNSITMNNLVIGPNRIEMNLGYAGASPDIDDQRNNPKLIAALSAQGKLH